MPTLQEIELRAQLARRDERINQLENQMELQTFRARADKFEGALRATRTSATHIDRLKIANERIQELEKQRDKLLAALTQMESAQQNELDNAKALAKSAMAELSSLTIAQQACIGCKGDGCDSFGMQCFGPPPVSECKDVPAGDAAIFAAASVKGGA